ncbi:hypothetical protein [Beijerinckia sp. L45]|uniref:hypothetical protein n=1 Tax=Beijerinckia sp. L45 TaxID=1641855 RepID=UPI00131E2EC7|nr:hypothetical protein [Beijerinckia sp. L45]
MNNTATEPTLIETIAIAIDEANIQIMKLLTDRDAHRSIAKYCDTEIAIIRDQIVALEKTLDGVRRLPKAN